MKKKAGRPKKVDKKQQVSTNLYPNEIEMLRVGSDRAGLSKANYIGSLLLFFDGVDVSDYLSDDSFWQVKNDWDAYTDDKKGEVI